MQFKFTVEYDGTNYAGWQRQKDRKTVQGELEAALERIFAVPITVRAAGRTDAGAHARGQVAAAFVPRFMAPAELQRALNALLAPDIVVVEALLVDDSFDPRRDARSRIYQYRVLNRPLRSAFECRYAWLVKGRLDLAKLEAAAALFLGKHDFAAFRTKGTSTGSTVRTVWASRWSVCGELFVYHVEANGFLRAMVRTMVALMVEVGSDQLGLDRARAILEAGERADAPAPAPACGLFLGEVRY